MNWKGKLKIWMDAGLINKEQADAIFAFENAKKIPYAFYSFLALGIVVLGLGVIALVAANWDQIHYSVKLFVSFSVLIGIALLILYSERRGFWNSSIRYLLVLLFSALCLANIGLISQIYHTQGKFYEAIALWCGMTFLLLFFYPGRILLHLWIAAFGFALFYALADLDMLSGQREYYIYLMAFWLSWVFGAISIFLDKRMESGEDRRSILANPFLVWYLFYFIYSSVLGTFLTAYDSVKETNLTGNYFTLPFPWYVPTILPLLFLLGGRLFRKRFSARKLVLFSISGIFLGLLNYPQLTHWAGKFPAIFYFFLAWFPLTFVFFQSRRWFDLCLTVIGIRFVVAYLEVFGTLLDTGVGLIISGIFILGFSALIFRLREKIRIKANQLFPEEELGL
ncbi:DUF2157 domain-containing protein [Leptospira langatensis]|uniref:DUF2157 domain-containing protein n=1 Tax=Leptospira langatensis TaxID=2484983 RepID=A0A5F1ZXA9_9LEPT|nr:DUF2157 domain-containing protein [Leptospira langatensis]TGJ98592.1 DUF2157 domain-containing protein [Leptospira langatensis]TGL43505.1 DUF2157 domain-containing protein [Leptospira langatensis]